MFAYDKTFDPEVVLGHYDLISRFSDFALYLDTQLVYFHTFYSPALKKWGYTGFTISFRRSVLPSFRYSVIPLFRPNFISTQYLENQFTESDQILYAH